LQALGFPYSTLFWFCGLLRQNVQVADIDASKEGYLKLKEDNKSVCKNKFCSTDFAASKRAAENMRILDNTEPSLASA
jgi:hypothetical protein